MEEVLQGVIEKILDNIKGNREVIIPEELIYELEKTSYQFICENREVQNIKALMELRSYLNSVWRSRSYYDLEPKAIFNMGRIFNIIDMLKIAEERMTDDIKVTEDAKKYINRYRVFKYINEVKGITHNDLAERAGLSISALSQFLGKIEYDKYVLYRKSGRCKYYYLTDYGKKMLTLMEQEVKCQEQAESEMRGKEKYKIRETNSWFPMYKISAQFSNQINGNSYKREQTLLLTKVVVDSNDYNSTKKKLIIEEYSKKPMYLKQANYGNDKAVRNYA